MHSKIFRFAAFWVVILVLSGCTWRQSFANLFNPLAYSQDPNSIVIYANYKTWPGAPELGQGCSFIPDLRIWGDGRFVKIDYVSGIRSVITGNLTEDEIDFILKEFDNAGFYKLKERYSIIPAATGLNIKIHLLRKTFDYDHWNPDKSFIEIINSVHPESEQIYKPGKALLIIVPFHRPYLPDQIIPWPQNARFHLTDVKKDGMWIDGVELNLIWDSINHDTLQMPVFSDNGKELVVALEIPGMSIQDPPFPCW